MLLFHIISISCLEITYHHAYVFHDTHRCAKLTSHYILNLRISFEEMALIKLQEFFSNTSNTQYDYMTTAQIYMSDIIRDLNIELEKYGIHIRPDYGQLIIENFPFEYDMSSCNEDNAVLLRTEVAHEFFDTTAVHGVGNRLLIFFCNNLFSSETALTHIVNVKECGHVSGVMYHDPEKMRFTLKNSILKMFTGGNRSDNISVTDFNNKLCRYVRDCVSEIGNTIGHYMSNMKNIKDISGNNFLMPVDSRTRMHSNHDAMAFAGAWHGNKSLYPVDNYSMKHTFAFNFPSN